MHEMDVAFVSLFHALILKWTVTTTHEKVELRTVPRDFEQQLTQLLDCILLPHQLC